MSLTFTWHPLKAESNQQKHDVTFEEAETVFGDTNHAVFYDVDHSDDEDRFIILGFSARGNLLFVSHLDQGDVIHLISARRATKHEHKIYENVQSK